MKEVENQKISRVLESQKIFDAKRSKGIKSYMGIFTFLFLSLGLLVTDLSQAKNLGVWGTIFPIIEQDIKEILPEGYSYRFTGDVENMKDTNAAFAGAIVLAVILSGQ